MKKSWLIAAVIVSCVLLGQVGCNEAVTVAEKGKSESPVSKAAVEPAKPQPEKAQPKPGPAVSRTMPKPAKAQTKPKPEQASPKIVFEKEVYDFGQIAPRTKNNCEFKFTNTGQGLLEIGKIRSSCGCTVPALSKKEYASGESGSIKVTYRTGSYPGGRKRYITVPSNDSARPKVRLTIKAKIVAKVDYEPKSMKLLLNRENAGCPKITLRSLDEQEFSIKHIKSTGNCISAEFDPSVKARRFVLDAKVDVEQARKLSSGTVNIGLTHPQAQTVSIRFTVLKRFRLNPSTLSIVRAEPGVPIRRKLYIINNYGEDFEIESAHSEKGIIKIVNQKKILNKKGVGDRYSFDLQITPPPPGRRTRFTDVFVVKIKGGETLRARCNGFYPRKSTKQSGQ